MVVLRVFGGFFWLPCFYKRALSGRGCVDWRCYLFVRANRGGGFPKIFSQIFCGSGKKFYLCSPAGGKQKTDMMYRRVVPKEAAAAEARSGGVKVL